MTTTTITAQYAGAPGVDGGVDVAGDGSDTLGVNLSIPHRHVASYNIGANIAVGQIASTIELLYTNVFSNAPSDSWYAGAYASDGNRDPSADPGLTMYANANVSGAPYVTTTALRSGGQQVIDITSVASLSHLQAAIDAARTVHAIAMQQLDETGTSHRVELGETSDGTPSKRPQLRVTHAAAAVGSVPQSRRRRLLMQLLAG
jgi:hypothetical protein